MHKSFETLALAGSALALATTGALAGAQEQMPETAPAPGQTTDTMPTDGMPETTTPPSMPDTTPSTAPEPDDGTTTDTPDMPATTTAPPTGDQDAMMQSWPADRQASFKAWPAETQTYFWSLNPQRQEIFWALSDSDKVTLSKMPEAQRESTWAQIESRLTPPRG